MNINTEGIVHVGEINTRAMREAQVAEDYHNAQVSGAVGVLTETALWVAGRIAASGPYDDTRALQELTVWIADRIREVQSPAMNEGHHG